MERSRVVGAGIAQAAAAAPEVLGLMDTVRAWHAESGLAAARAENARAFEEQVRGIVGEVLDGSRESPGLRAWWRQVETSLAAEIEAHSATRREIESARARAVGRAGELRGIGEG